MGRVVFVPTGRLELAALPASFERLFPGHEFVCRSALGEEPLPGFTSGELPRFDDDLTESNVWQLVEVAVVAVSARPAPALVVVLDDLEVLHAHREDEVIQVFRRAAQEFAAPLRTHQQRLIRDRVSFHLAVPMIESWIFADALGPQRAGAHRPAMPFGEDPERFSVDDAAYATDAGAACSAWLSLPQLTKSQRDRYKKCRPGWIRSGRERHPKAYLQWLCFDATEKSCTSYAETAGGAAAVRHLDWSGVLQRPGMSFLRALVEDIADALGEQPPFHPWPSSPADALSRKYDDGDDYTLRNL